MACALEVRGQELETLLSVGRIGAEQPKHLGADAVIAAIGVSAGDYGDAAGHRRSDAPKPAGPFRLDRQIELERVSPSGEIRIATVRKDPLASSRLQPYVIPRLAGQVLRGSFDEELRMLLDPGMVGRDVVGDEVENESLAPASQAVPQSRQGLVAPKVLVNVILANREGRAYHVGLRIAGKLRPPGRISHHRFPGEPMTRVLVRDQGKIFPIHVDAIEYLRSDTKYTALVSKGRSFLVRLPITSFEQRLDPARFLKLHRSCIVNLDFVEAMTPDENSQLVAKMTDGTLITCNREVSRRLREQSI